jgi:hypothetical protein
MAISFSVGKMRVEMLIHVLFSNGYTGTYYSIDSTLTRSPKLAKDPAKASERKHKEIFDFS